MLTWECLEAWQRSTGTIVHPHEARALMTLDAILCHPDPDAIASDEDEPEDAHG